MVAVLTADLVKSSLYEEEILKKVLNALKAEFVHIKDTYGEESVRFTIYRGIAFRE